MPDTRPMQILLVEDDLPLGAALQASLARAGYGCTWVRRLAEARAHVHDGGFDALLLDINLPDGEGFELLQALRNQGLALPVLLLTARDALGDRLRGFEGGADDYLVKPFAVDEMLARLGAVLRRSAGQAQACWQLGRLRLMPGRREASVEARRLPLARREFDVLLALAQQAGQVLRREELVRRVWGAHHDISNGALDVLLHGLRKKLAPVRIHTVRGVGYLLEDG